MVALTVKAAPEMLHAGSSVNNHGVYVAGKGTITSSGTEATVTDCNLLLGYLDQRSLLGGELADALEGALGLPVRYVGTGEQLELLEVFEPEAFVDAIVSRAARCSS